MTTKLIEVKAFLKLMKKNNVLSLKVGDIEIICSEHVKTSVIRKPKEKEIKESVIKADLNLTAEDMVDEELIYWSSDAPTFAKKRN